MCRCWRQLVRFDDQPDVVVGINDGDFFFACLRKQNSDLHTRMYMRPVEFNVFGSELVIEEKKKHKQYPEMDNTNMLR